MYIIYLQHLTVKVTRSVYLEVSVVFSSVLDVYSAGGGKVERHSPK